MVDDDWRLQGQDKYLRGLELTHQRWTQTRQHSDHDHCEFCWAKFSVNEGDLHEGYTTADQYRWICKTCFVDSRDRFEWIVAEAAS